MSSDLLLLVIQILLLIVLVAVSAFCSSAEIALFSLSHARILSYKNSSSIVEQKIHFLMNRQHQTLITIILGNMFVNSTIAMVNSSIIGKMPFSPAVSLIVSAISGIVILLLFGEITPMTLAYMYSEPWSRVVALPVYWMRKILAPLTASVEKICDKILNLSPKPKSAGLSAEEYLSYLDVLQERNIFSGSEVKLMKESFSLRSKSVRSVMRNRTDLAFIRWECNAETVCDTIRENAQAYLAVSKDKRLDASDGLLSSRAFFAMTPEEREHWSSSSCVTHEPLFIPDTTTLEKALKTLRSRGVNAALASDEYGSVTGIITVEDIYSEVTGRSIELDNQAGGHFFSNGKNSWIMDGRFTVEDISSKIPREIDFSRFAAKTLSGIFCELHGAIPVKNDVVTFDNVRLTALFVAHHRIAVIRLDLLEPEESGEKE